MAEELPQLNFPLLPTLLISMAAYLIASAFFSVYEMAIDTLFLCFLQVRPNSDEIPAKQPLMGDFLTIMIEY